MLKAHLGTELRSQDKPRRWLSQASATSPLSFLQQKCKNGSGTILLAHYLTGLKETWNEFPGNFNAALLQVVKGFFFCLDCAKTSLPAYIRKPRAVVLVSAVTCTPPFSLTERNLVRLFSDTLGELLLSNVPFPCQKQNQGRTKEMVTYFYLNSKTVFQESFSCTGL